jgi:hypothetical protein
MVFISFSCPALFLEFSLNIVYLHVHSSFLTATANPIVIFLTVCKPDPLEEVHHEKWQKSGRLYRLLPAD